MFNLANKLPQNKVSHNP